MHAPKAELAEWDGDSETYDCRWHNEYGRITYKAPGSTRNSYTQVKQALLYPDPQKTKNLNQEIIQRLPPALEVTHKAHYYYYYSIVHYDVVFLNMLYKTFEKYCEPYKSNSITWLPSTSSLRQLIGQFLTVGDACQSRLIKKPSKTMFDSSLPPGKSVAGKKETGVCEVKRLPR